MGGQRLEYVVRLRCRNRDGQPFVEEYRLRTDSMEDAIARAAGMSEQAVEGASAAMQSKVREVVD